MIAELHREDYLEDYSNGAIYENNRLVGWRRKWIELRCIKSYIADEIIKAHHYSGKATSNRFLSMGVFYNNRLLGAVQLGYGIRPKIKGTWGDDVTGDNSREFDRMWLSDECPKFSESIVLSCLERYLIHAYPNIKYLITYADGSVGNTGTIYKAANYKPMGSIKADFYILASGERVHPVTMWHRHKTRAWAFLQEQYPGIKKADGRQYKFIKKLRTLSKQEKIIEEEQLNLF